MSIDGGEPASKPARRRLSGRAGLAVCPATLVMTGFAAGLLWTLAHLASADPLYHSVGERVARVLRRVPPPIADFPISPADWESTLEFVAGSTGTFVAVAAALARAATIGGGWLAFHLLVVGLVIGFADAARGVGLTRRGEPRIVSRGAILVRAAASSAVWSFALPGLSRAAQGVWMFADRASGPPLLDVSPVGLGVVAATFVATHLFVVARAVRAAKRDLMPPGYWDHHCRGCGYPRRGDGSPVCPECGLNPGRHAPPFRGWTRKWMSRFGIVVFACGVLLALTAPIWLIHVWPGPR